MKGRQLKKSLHIMNTKKTLPDYFTDVRVLIHIEADRFWIWMKPKEIIDPYPTLMVLLKICS